MKVVIINLFVLIGLIATFEVGARYFIHAKYLEKRKVSCENCRNYEVHNELGYWHKANSSHIARKTCEVEACYEATYTYDDFGRRSAPHPEKNYDRHLFIFGGSFAFGEGLNDKETLAYQLQGTLNAKTYNYAKSAAGPLHTLRLFEKNFVNASQNSGLALYFLNEFHIDRVSMDSQRHWLWKTPGYKKCKADKICSIGQKENINLFYSQAIKSIHWLNRNSTIFNFFNRDIHSKDRTENLELLALALKKIKEYYEKSYSGQFLVILLPDYSYSTDLLKQLQSHSIPVLKIKDSGLSDDKRYVCRCDKHPSGHLTRHIAKEITSYYKQHIVPKLE